MKQGVFLAVIQDGKILLTERKDGKGWNLPGGGAEEGEDKVSAAMREGEEELGIPVKILKIVSTYPMTHNGLVVDEASVFLAELEGENIALDGEASQFGWFSEAELQNIRIVQRPCPGYPHGRMIQMILDAFHEA